MEAETDEGSETGERAEASLVDAYQAGVSLRQLAKSSGISRTTLTRRLRSAGVVMRAPRVVLPSDPVWWQARLADVSVSSLAAEFGVSSMSVYRHLSRMGLGRSIPVGFDAWLAARTRVDGQCLRWIRGHTSDGAARTHRDGAAVTAHRVVWEHSFGPLTAGIDVVHRPGCRFADCVRIEHLRSVAAAERVAADVEQGIFPRGEHHWNAKLAESDARHILTSNQSTDELAAQYGISKATVAAIRARRRWRWLTSQPT